MIVKRCQVCGRENAARNLLCEGCAASLAMVPVEEVEDSEIEPERIATPLEKEGKDVVICWNCGTQMAVGEATCIRCAMPLVRKNSQVECHSENQPQRETENRTQREEPCQAIIRFPWGDVVVDQRLGIGRDSKHSSIATYLVNFQRVSRKHAEILRDGHRFIIIDTRSLNHTFVNGRELVPGEMVELYPRDKLLFSSEVAAEVIEIKR